MLGAPAALLSTEDDPGGREQEVQQANVHSNLSKDVQLFSTTSHYMQSVTGWLIVCEGNKILTGAWRSLTGASSWWQQEAIARLWREESCSAEDTAIHYSVSVMPGVVIKSMGQRKPLF